MIETERLYLRPIAESDLENLTALFTDRDVMHYSISGTLSAEKVAEVLSSMLEQQKEYGLGACAIIKKDTEEFLGFCGIYWDEEPDFAYRLLKKFWNQGYATEAVRGYFEYTKQQMPDITLYTYVQADNIGSVRIAEKTGMTFVKDTTYHGVKVQLWKL